MLKKANATFSEDKRIVAEVIINPESAEFLLWICPALNLEQSI
jgi:hypothetical protein